MPTEDTKIKKTKPIEVGSKVKIKAKAKSWTGQDLPKAVAGRLTVFNLNGKKAILIRDGAIVCAVNVDDLTAV